LLDGVCDARAEATRWEALAVERAITWMGAVVEAAPTERELLHDMPIGGDGAPAVPEAAVAEFAAAMRMTGHAARSYLADAWDLAWRFPSLREAVSIGQVPAWRARIITSATHGLNSAAASWIDEVVTPSAGRIGPARLKRLVVRAEALTDPDAAQARAVAAAESRGVVCHPSDQPTGLIDVVATLDHGDADDLEAAIALVAGELGHSDETAEEALTVRRAKALGIIARRQLSGWTGTADETTSRVLHTYVHLNPGEPLARLEKADTLLPVSMVAEWCAKTGTKVVVTPVLDLNAELTRDGYVPTPAMREQAIVRDRTCAHPYCERQARSSDLDHVHPYDPDGPPGQTRTTNLAPLCRHHHRLKTHAGWSYRYLDPGHYLWRSPDGRHYLRTPRGTLDLGFPRATLGTWTNGSASSPWPSATSPQHARSTSTGSAGRPSSRTARKSS
jgi:hypothetical protein